MLTLLAAFAFAQESDSDDLFWVGGGLAIRPGYTAETFSLGGEVEAGLLVKKGVFGARLDLDFQGTALPDLAITEAAPDVVPINMIRPEWAMLEAAQGSWAARGGIINADACDTLVRVSGSQIASEANDLNTSLMTADGTVLAAGKYTMVLSTSLNFVVADILSRYQDNPGIRPGDQTSRYIDKILTRLTLAGAIYITAVCLLPEFLILKWNVPFYFGGTSLLIIVVVTMDFMSQVQAYVMSHQYESLLKKANFKGAGFTAR